MIFPEMRSNSAKLSAKSGKHSRNSKYQEINSCKKVKIRLL